MKNQIINFRVSDYVKEDLELQAEKEAIPVSDVVRKAIMQYLHNPNIEDELTLRARANAKYNILSSKGFAELILWFHAERLNLNYDEIPGVFNFIVQHLRNAQQKNSIEGEFVNEIDVLSNNLIGFVENLNGRVKNLILYGEDYKGLDNDQLNEILNELASYLKASATVYLKSFHDNY